jgi:hypothetical protein
MTKLNFLLLGTLLCLCPNLFAQDLLVKTNNDSVNCKVVKQNSETVYFFTYQNNKEIMNAIPKSEIKSMVLNYYANSPAKQTYTIDSTGKRTVNTTTGRPTARPAKKVYESIPGARFSANYSATFLLAPIDPSVNSFLRDYIKELRTGNGYAFSFNYYGKKNMGIGLQYISFLSSHSLENVTAFYNNGGSYTGTLKDNINITYIGASFGFRYPMANKKWRVLGDLGFGASNYTNNSEFQGKTKITASTLGINTQIGFDYSLAENLSIGVIGTLIRASVREYVYDDGTTQMVVTLPEGESESHSRAEISVGLRFLIE